MEAIFTPVLCENCSLCALPRRRPAPTFGRTQVFQWSDVAGTQGMAMLARHRVRHPPPRTQGMGQQGNISTDWKGFATRSGRQLRPDIRPGGLLVHGTLLRGVWKPVPPVSNHPALRFVGSVTSAKPALTRRKNDADGTGMVRLAIRPFALGPRRMDMLRDPPALQGQIHRRLVIVLRPDGFVASYHQPSNASEAASYRAAVSGLLVVTTTHPCADRNQPDHASLRCPATAVASSPPQCPGLPQPRSAYQRLAPCARCNETKTVNLRAILVTAQGPP